MAPVVAQAVAEVAAKLEGRVGATAAEAKEQVAAQLLRVPQTPIQVYATPPPRCRL